jgi:hypothetical protein
MFAEFMQTIVVLWLYLRSYKMEDKLNITSAQYCLGIDGSNSGIEIVVDGEVWLVPLAAGNRHYDEIMRQVNAGTLTIQDAD